MNEHKPLYPYSRGEAVRRGERDIRLYKESHNENVACAGDIKKAIAENFDGYRLKAGIEKPIIEKYGFDRVNFVLANTLQHFDYDGRISADNKAWAKSIYIPDNDDKNSERGNTRDFLIDNVGLANVFLDSVRKQYKELNLWDSSHCIPSLGLDFENKIMVIKPEILKDEYKKPDYQLFYAQSGFGCSPDASGRKVFGAFLVDSEKATFDRSNFIGQLKPELVPEWAADKVKELQKPSIRKQLAEMPRETPKPKKENRDKGAR